MALNNRYEPSHPQGQGCQYAMDFANILPLGVTLQTGLLSLLYNTVPPTPATPTDFVVGPVQVNGRRLYASLSGGVSGNDYRLQWAGVDSLGNNWIRTALLLCAATS
jgi:hypothetical protein